MLDSENILDKLDKDITGMSDVCTSGEPVSSFPEILKKGIVGFGIGLIVCIRGNFRFSVSGNFYTANAGDTVFIPEGKTFMVVEESADMECSILIYRIEPIKDVIGNMVHSLHLYYRMSPDINCVWSTGDEGLIQNYISIIGNNIPDEDDYLAVNERKLLLLALTYKLCDIFQKRFLSGKTVKARSTEIFLNLIKLIDKYYMKQRGVEFYADKLCLSPKYLSGVSKSISGY